MAYVILVAALGVVVLIVRQFRHNWKHVQQAPDKQRAVGDLLAVQAYGGLVFMPLVGVVWFDQRHGTPFAVICLFAMIAVCTWLLWKRRGSRI